MNTTTPHSLIGRDLEFDRLMSGVEGARSSGRGTLFLISGEPGIGQTRLAEAFTERAEADGLPSVWGRCWENPGAPPYWPWAQALRALTTRHEGGELAHQLGGVGDWIAELVPELRQRLPGIEPVGSLRSEQARFALFDAVATYLRTFSDQAPLVIVIDDLHAADSESLAMLDFVARSLREAPVVIVVAYQDAAMRARTDVEKLFRDLAVRGRQLPLGGITEDDVGRIVEAEAGASVPRELVHALHVTTEGNPLFAGEVARLLSSEGQLAAWESDEAGRLPLPDTVRETIRRRLEPLGPAVVYALKTAAVIGREFRLATLERVVTGDSCVALVDAARGRGIVSDVPRSVGLFRFTHGLMRETLYAELTTAERIDLHRDVGRALEEVHGDDPQHLAELAHHFAEAAPAGYSEQALEYAERAGGEAMRILAYERATQLFELASEVEEQLPYDAARHARLLLQLGMARTRAGDPAARPTLLAAAECARAVNDSGMLAQAALGIHVFNLTPGVPDDSAIGLLEEAIERLGPADSAHRARLLARLATALYYRWGTAERRDALVTEAVAMARRLDDPATLAYVLSNGQLGTWGPDTTERDLDWVDELLVLTEEAGNAELALQTRTRQIDYLLELDDMVGADIALLALARTAAESPEPRAPAYLHLQRARRAAIEGSYAEAEESNAEAKRLGLAIEDRMLQLLAAAQLSMLRWTQGRIGEMEKLVRGFADAAPAIVGWRAALARVYCAVGRDEEARRELERLDQRGFASLPRYNGWLNMMALLSEVCAHLDDASRARAVYQLLLPFERRNIVTAQCVFDGPAARYLGILATTMCEWDAAARHFDVARVAAERQHARPFTALIDIEEARLLTRRAGPGDAGRAAALLDEAQAIAGELQMDAIVARAEQARAQAPPEAPGQAPPADHSVASVSGEMRWEGDVWTLHLDGRSVHIRDSKGVRCLATLLSNPGVEIHSLQLAGVPSRGTSAAASAAASLTATGSGDAGPILDPQAKAAYRRRLDELREELDEAEAFNDPERASRARAEMDFIAAELAGAVGLGGRDRRTSSNAERARVAVTKAVRATLKRISEMDQDLGAELGATVRTGTFCVYEPDRHRPVEWMVERG
jgi:hypothetical protein